MLKRLKIIFIVLVISSCGQSPDEFSKQGIDLSSGEWSIRFDNKKEYMNPEFNHSKWKKINLPKNLKTINRSYEKNYWLRKTFSLDRENIRGNLALYLGRVYTDDRVYINGILIGLNGSSAREKKVRKYNFDRSRIYRIQPNILLPGENTIAIRLSSDSMINSGIVSFPITIINYGMAYQYLYQQATNESIFAGIYLFIGIFFLINFIKMREFKEYLSFSLLIICFAMYQITRNEIRFLLYDSFTIFKFLEYFLLLNIPYLYMLYFSHFLKIERSKYLKYYGIFNLLLLSIFFIFKNPVMWHNIIIIWSFHLFILVAYSLYISFVKMKESVDSSLTKFFKNLFMFFKGSYRGTLIFFLSISYFFYSICKEILIEMGIVQSISTVDTAFLVIIFSSTVALRMRFIGLKINILKRYEQLQEVDKFRARLFFYMDKIMTSSITETKTLLHGMATGQENKSALNRIKKDFTQIQQSMDDILELSRLEVTGEMLYIERVNFVDYIRIVIPEGQITYTIKVDPRYEIENNLELINSLIIRLIDFSGFKDFENIDLIITNDLNNKIHFRFMLYHKNQSVILKLYKELLDINKENIQSIRWAIINENLRLLGGNIEIGLLNKKYLRVDIDLDAMPLPNEEPKKINKPATELTLQTESGKKIKLNMDIKDLKNADVGELLRKVVANMKMKIQKKKKK